MSTESTFVIVGAGLTAATAAQTLRESGFDGRVVIVGDEPEPPYERPPLSKGYLLGNEERSVIFPHDADWYTEHSVELRLSRRVTDLDRLGRTIGLDDGDRIEYSKLLLATGASPRKPDLPGVDLDRVHTLRRVGDTERLGSALRTGGRVAVIGAGWIGLETAAAARELGCPVTVFEPQPTPLYGALGPELGEFFADLHRRHGVELRLGTGVAEIRAAADGGVGSVVADDGTQTPADLVILSVGALPDTALADQSGLAVDNGILVDASLRTVDPEVFAAGDVANPINPRYGRRVRVEHWDNAVHSGQAVARSMLGEEVAYDRVPYFFTDQYDVGMEYSGWYPAGGYDTVVIRGNLADQAFFAFWLLENRLVAAMHVNQWDEGIAGAQALIEAGAVVDQGRLADPGVPLDRVVEG